MLLPWQRRIVAIVTASVATLPLHVVIIVAAAIPLPLALITADTLPGVEGGATWPPNSFHLCRKDKCEALKKAITA